MSFRKPKHSNLGTTVDILYGTTVLFSMALTRDSGKLL